MDDDGPGVFLFRWVGHDDDNPGNLTTYGGRIDACSWEHAENRCRELGVELVGKME